MTALQYPVCNWRLSPQRERVLNFCQQHVAQTGHMPTNKQIAEHMGWKCDKSVPTALQSLVMLGKMKVSKRTPSGRGWSYQFDLIEDQSTQVEGANG